MGLELGSETVLVAPVEGLVPGPWPVMSGIGDTINEEASRTGLYLQEFCFLPRQHAGFYGVTGSNQRNVILVNQQAMDGLVLQVLGWRVS